MRNPPKQLTYRQTIEQELRALRRLRDKRLCCGPFYLDGVGCALAAFDVHAQRAGPIDDLKHHIWTAAEAIPGWFFRDAKASRFLADHYARYDIVRANENFRRDNNSLKAQRARYQHMVRWCIDWLAKRKK